MCPHCGREVGAPSRSLAARGPLPGPVLWPSEGLLTGSPGSRVFLEAKAIKGQGRSSFYISHNEFDFAAQRSSLVRGGGGGRESNGVPV